MAYKVWQTGNQVQSELNDVEYKLEAVTNSKSGYMTPAQKVKLDDLENAERIRTFEIDQIWESVII